MKHKKMRRKTLFLIVWLVLIALLLVGIIILSQNHTGKAESIQEVMKDGVLHENDRINLFGILVNPALISAYVVTGVLLLSAVVIRIFAIPRFKDIPGKFQNVIEKIVEFFSDMAKGNSPHKNGFIGAYIFSAGLYVFVGTLFELFGLQAISAAGHSVTLSAPLADINAAIAMGVLSYLIILGGGLFCNGFKGMLGVLKDFSLPISMSFRLFGALLSGLLVTELVYYYISLSFVLPVIVGIIFTILHAIIQTFVLTTLVSTFYGEAVEPKPQKIKEKKVKKVKKV